MQVQNHAKKDAEDGSVHTEDDPVVKILIFTAVFSAISKLPPYHIYY